VVMPDILSRMSIDESLDVTLTDIMVDYISASHHQPCRIGGRQQLAASR